MKTKDYLGKARLVAASDRANAFTGFAGSEIKKMNDIGSGSRDDRPEEKLSYAATNLVKPNLQSRSRQQSEPPMNRNMFPPTPPPESDKRISGGERQMTRAQSVRGGGPKPVPLNLGRAAFDQSNQEAPRRIGTQRSASERPPPSRMESTRSRTAGGRDRPRRRGSDEDPDDYDEVYDLYQGRSNRGSYTRSRQGKSSRPMYIDEEEEDDYDLSDVDDGDFEMISRAKSRRRSPARSSASRRAPERDVSAKIRVKVHAGDTRYVFIDNNKTMREFVQQIRDKFGIRSNFKIEIKDDGDMITMADDDDLDMAVQTARSMARKENSDMPKMEVWLNLALVPSRNRSSLDLYYLGNESTIPPPLLTPSIEVSEYI